jgi:hypothetical protein
MTEPVPPPRKRSNTATWKQGEIRIAQILGGRRVPVTGRSRGDAPDIEHPALSLEVKHGRHVPKLLETALEQAEKAVRGGKTPVVVMHPHGARYDDCLVILRIRDFVRFLPRE